MAKVVITMGDTPADCSVVVNGAKLDNIVGIEASVTIDTPPAVRLTTINRVDHSIDVKDIEFTPSIDERGTPISVSKDKVIVKGKYRSIYE